MVKFHFPNGPEFDVDAQLVGDVLRFEIKKDGDLVGSFLWGQASVDSHLRPYVREIDKALSLKWIDFGNLQARRCATCGGIVTARTNDDRPTICPHTHNVDGKDP